MAATEKDPKGVGRLGLVAAGLGALTASAARADGSVDFKLLHYRESDGRTQVTNPEIYFTHDVGEKGQIGLLLGYDSISGASPTGEAPTLDATASASSASDSIPMAEYSDTRSAASLSYTRRFGSHLPTVTLSYSRESDYLSNGISLVDAWDLFGGRSTLRLGVGTSRDRIDPVNQNVQFDKKSLSFSAGWTQVLGPRDLLDLSVGIESLSGYLDDPYKLVTIAGAALPERRPGSRDRTTALLKYGHYFLSRGALKTSYRYYRDDWSIQAHTLDLTYDQRIGRRWILTPRLRLYRQGSASFFGYEFDSAEPYMSSDYRLSSFWSWLGGLGLTVDLTDRFSLNLAASYLDQTGLDRVRPARTASTLLATGSGASLLEEEEEEGEGRPGLISPADLTTLTGTLGFTVRF